jgi:predicted DCC family thiol-disulfide oxidoreductase YuxK
MKTSEDHPVIFFDGECNLCNGFVQIVIRNDPHARFRFASLQSEHARDIPALPDTAEYAGGLSTVIVKHRGAYLSKSSAVLKIAKLLGFPYSLFYVLIVLPKPIRDSIYEWVAANRYKWFGKRDACMLPTSDLKSRFL